MTGERNKLIWGEIVARAWRDAAFKQQLLGNPKTVLTEAGMSVPEDVELQVVQDTPTLRHLVLPVAPTGGSSTLSEAALDLVSGGGSTATTTTTVQTQTAVTTSTEVEEIETTTTTTAEAEAEVAVVAVVVPVLIT
ncbi:NHLP leader peptide family natural product precursor [Microcystis wesenbergii FACHB-1317]|uniref:NHLP leader peptide family RiPP precursor n=1 Tax=Microcystis TaxID=1125 RepID=UPI000E36ED1D|nr:MULTISPECIES: NHLP leader peptide family RiPP precursor [Microcystis]MBD2287754.1 NHLP leader peptide family natural product precursor [Microcystis wesenbergii FACHB-1317]REJ58598.1 MAG: NHLP leader peptide family natural product precursor [Microcystis aeruginosa TA09]UZO78490.1 NHLP leader peptide family RiPP precursor [Microcystis aeruginosa str. Chao 1910]